jgi:hypothetical protein
LTKSIRLLHAFSNVLRLCQRNVLGHSTLLYIWTDSSLYPPFIRKQKTKNEEEILQSPHNNHIPSTSFLSKILGETFTNRRSQRVQKKPQ